MALHLTVSIAQASCGAANCPIDMQTQEKTEKGMIRLDYSYESINQNQPRIGRRKAEVGEIRGHHDEVSTFSQTQRVTLDVGLSSRLSVQAVIPSIHRQHEHIHNHHGTPIQENWDLTGMGDMGVQARYVVGQPEGESSPIFSVIAGGIFPTGRDHATNDDGDEADAGISLGKNAYSAIGGLSSLQFFTARTFNGQNARMPLFFSSTYQWNGQGNEGYKIGDVWLVNAGTIYPMLPKVGFMAQLNFQVNGGDDRGETTEEVEKTGGTYLYATPGIQLTMAENLLSYFYVQLPIYQRVNPIQLTSDYNVIGGVSYKFSAL